MLDGNEAQAITPASGKEQCGFNHRKIVPMQMRCPPEEIGGARLLTSVMCEGSGSNAPGFPICQGGVNKYGRR